MYTVNEIKPHLMTFAMMANTLVLLVPGDGGKVIKDIVAIMQTLVTQDWFAEVLCDLLNDFNDGKLNSEEIKNLLAKLADKLKK